MRWAREISTDLIILGPHSTRAEEKGVVRTIGKIGSTVEGVIMRENCPVMIVNTSIQKVLLPWEDSLTEKIKTEKDTDRSIRVFSKK